MNEAFVTRIKVGFADVDHAGIVFYPRFFEYFHEAFEAFFTVFGGMPYHEVLNRDRVGFPAVRAEADYQSPLRYGDEVDMTVTVARLGTKSAGFRYVGRRAADGTPCVEGRVTIVTVSMDSFRGIPIPDKFRALFERALEQPSG
ncbi:MAG: 1,4-dihydroxy-2-naphthoyl-CoA hydrolase [Myxococcota bacterium]|nr:1,4-dihydroxy-2-naphthoyl-CoA hydrolase [Myxococcota bacterium]